MADHLGMSTPKLAGVSGEVSDAGQLHRERILGSSPSHMVMRMSDEADREIHQRWTANLPKHRYGLRQEDWWYFEQCGGCNAYRPIAGPIGHDWGACTSAASPCDGTIRFEHDGCEAFSPAGPQDFAPFA